MERYLLITMHLDPAHVQDVVDAYREHGRVAAATEPGLVRFDVHQDEADPTRIVLYEAYASDAAHAAHVAGNSHQRARGLGNSLIEQGKARRESLALRPVFAHPSGRR